MAEESIKLRQWVVEELKIPGISAEADFSYVCRGDLVKVWSYLAANVMSTANAQQIQKSLRLHQASNSAAASGLADDPLEEKRKLFRKLTQQVQQQNAELEKLEATIQIQNDKLSSLSQKGKHRSSEQRDLKMKVCLLTQHRGVMDYQHSAIGRFQANLQQHIDSYTHKKDVYGSSDTQTSHFSQLKKLQKAVTSFLHQLLQGSISKQLLQKEKTHIKRNLGQILSAIGPSEVIRYLIHEVNRTSDLIAEETKQIDYIRDAEALRFRVVADGLVDESADPPLEAGVSQLIEQRQLEHQDRFLQTQGHRTIAQSLYNEQERLRREMSDRLSLLKHDQRYSLIRDIMDKKITECQTKAALETILATNKVMKEEVDENEKRISSLRQKHRLISGFRSDVHSKQNQICVLMKQNIDSQQKLNERQSLILSTINTLMSNAEPLVLLNSSSLSENYDTELSRLRTTPLYALSDRPHTTLTGVQTHQGKAATDLREVQTLLGIKHYQSCDVLMEDILNKHREVLMSYTMIPAIGESENSGSLLTSVDQLLPRCKEATEKLKSELMPTLKRSKDLTVKGLRKCDQIDTLIDHWWHQPGLRLDLDPIDMDSK